jgi:hypothetical protein
MTTVNAKTVLAAVYQILVVAEDRDMNHSVRDSIVRVRLNRLHDHLTDLANEAPEPDPTGGTE